MWVKDSSQLTPQDFMALYTQILNLYAEGNRQFVALQNGYAHYLGAFWRGFRRVGHLPNLNRQHETLIDANVVADTVDDYVIDGTSDVAKPNDAVGLHGRRDGRKNSNGW